MGIRYEGYENSQADLLKVGKLSLKECINICRSAEAIKGHMKLMSSIVKEDIHKVSVRSTYNPKRPVNDRGKHQKYSAKGTMSRCKFCGQEHVFKKSECPAWGAICKKCHHQNHFAIVCKNSDNSSRVDYINAVRHHIYTVSDELSKPLYASIKVNKEAVKFQIDPGATINVIPRRFVKNI